MNPTEVHDFMELETELRYCNNKVIQLEQEKAKLMEAMKEIAAYGTDGICPYGCDTPYIAQKALERMEQK